MKKKTLPLPKDECDAVLGAFVGLGSINPTSKRNWTIITLIKRICDEFPALRKKYKGSYVVKSALHWTGPNRHCRLETNEPIDKKHLERFCIADFIKTLNNK